jgi:protein-S-isoprenylcysteine O-methyltransferase Ste14
MLLLRSIFFTLLMPGTVTIVIQYRLVSSQARHNSQPYQVLQYLGVPLIIIGAVALLWSIWRFYSDGQGTLAPVDPPKVLVVRGLYRYVRNPMYVGVLWILLGEAIWFLSGLILFEAGLFLGVTHLFVKYYEEPALRRQFGEAYESYMQSAGRLFPRYRFRTR